MKKLKSEIIKIVKQGKGVPVGYHCNSFGEDQIELIIGLFKNLKTKTEKKLFEKIMHEFLNSRMHNLRWVAYVVSKTLDLSSAGPIITNLIKNNKIDERDIHIGFSLVKEIKTKMNDKNQTLC